MAGVNQALSGEVVHVDGLANKWTSPWSVAETNSSEMSFLRGELM